MEWTVTDIKSTLTDLIFQTVGIHLFTLFCVTLHLWDNNLLDNWSVKRKTKMFMELFFPFFKK